VFDVELSEGAPALKLPFNKGDDPWMAAHKFLNDNELDPMFLDQVAKFITDQVKDVVVGPMAPVHDPFTGDGAYVPESIYGKQNGTSNHPEPVASPTVYFPKTSCIGFDQANVFSILGKLREFNVKVDEGQRINDNVLDSLEHVMAGEGPSNTQVEAISMALHWPIALRFPALDVLRLSLRHDSANTLFCSSSAGTALLEHLLTPLASTSPPPAAVTLLTIRALANSLRQPAGVSLLTGCLPRLCELVKAVAIGAGVPLLTAIASLILNLSVVASKAGYSSAMLLKTVVSLSENVSPTSHAEPAFRLLVAIGTLLSTCQKSLDVGESLVTWISVCEKVTEPLKVADSAKQLRETVLSS
jgi:phospholipase A-2-activating protein